MTSKCQFSGVFKTDLSRQWYLIKFLESLKTLSFQETTVSDKILVSSVLSQSFLVADERSVLLNNNGNRTRLGRHSACIGKRKLIQDYYFCGEAVQFSDNLVMR